MGVYTSRCARAGGGSAFKNEFIPYEYSVQSLSAVIIKVMPHERGGVEASLTAIETSLSI